MGSALKGFKMCLNKKPKKPGRAFSNEACLRVMDKMKNKTGKTAESTAG
jgi:hypothetical protein